MKNYKLTVAIPTFDRPDKLIRLVSQLTVFLEKGDWNLIIYDNNSNKIPDLNISEFKNAKIVKRPINIGPTANILRIFEDCESDWLIIIGDDDEVTSKFYTIVMETINRYEEEEEFIAFKFKSELDKSQIEKSINSIEDFFKYNSNLHQFGASALISTWLYRVMPIKPYLRHAYLNSGLQIPHVVPVLEIIKAEGKKMLYLTSEPVKWNPGDAFSTWSYGRTYSLMLMNFLIYPLVGEGENIKYILKGVVGITIKNLLGFLIRLYCTLPKGNFNNILLIFIHQGYKYFLTSLIFISIKPFLRINFVKLFIHNRFDHSDTSRM